MNEKPSYMGAEYDVALLRFGIFMECIKISSSRFGNSIPHRNLIDIIGSL